MPPTASGDNAGRDGDDVESNSHALALIGSCYARSLAARTHCQLNFNPLPTTDFLLGSLLFFGHDHDGPTGTGEVLRDLGVLPPGQGEEQFAVLDLEDAGLGCLAVLGSQGQDLRSWSLVGIARHVRAG